MQRQIDKPIQSPQDYLDRLYQILPTEITAAYVVVQTLLANPNQVSATAGLLFGFAAFATILVPLYLWKFQGVDNWIQLTVSTLSFPIWAANISIATLLVTFQWVSSSLVAIIMIGWVLVIPILVPAKSQSPAPNMQAQAADQHSPTDVQS